MDIGELPNFPLDAALPLATHFRALQIGDFISATSYVRKLPYGRPRDVADARAVLTEGKGTCSSKHILLARLAHEHGQFEIKLTIGIYAMCEANTPGVGEVLRKYGLISIPEAHCYLVHGNNRYDFTGLPIGGTSPFDALLAEECVDPSAVHGSKEQRHRAVLDAWAVTRGLEPRLVWKAREECIEALAGRRSS